VTYWTGLRQRLPAYGLALGVLLVFGLLPDPPDEPYPVVIVHREVIEAREPSPDRTILDRAANATPDPVRTATAPGGAVSDVQAFCAGEVAKAVAALAGSEAPSPTEPTASPQPVIQPLASNPWLIRSGSNNAGWFFGRSTVLLTGPAANGDLIQREYRPWSDWSVRVDGGEALFRTPRFGWFRPVIEAGVFVGIGFLAGRIF